jgi:hypothetical protein
MQKRKRKNKERGVLWMKIILTAFDSRKAG